jgi:pyruvate dehydrogenase E2 component (dihydrolipoamide acetyltransferase)
MELESYEDGTLLYVGAAKDESVLVDGLLAIIGDQGADISVLIDKMDERTKTAASVEPVKEEKMQFKKSNETEMNITPLEKGTTDEMGIDFIAIKGSGSNSEIPKKDVTEFDRNNKFKQEFEERNDSQKAQLLGQESYTDVPVSQMRKVIAKKVSESNYSAPHFFLTIEINMDNAIAARTSINEISPVKVSYNDMVIKCVAAALRKHPQVNSSWQNDKIRYNHHIHISVAVAVEDGVLMPVVKFSDSKSLSQIAAEVKDLGAKAKNKKLQPVDWSGNTFAISNLGMFGVDAFTGIINAPDAGILAVGGITQEPIVVDGQMKIGNLMKVTLSCDHRVLDGAVAAAFLKTLKELLENPIHLLA